MDPKHSPAAAERRPAPPFEEKRMSLWLGLGVLVLPWLFCWATVRRKHTPLARVVSFGWAMVCLVFVVGIVAEGAVRRAHLETRAVVRVAEQEKAAEQRWAAEQDPTEQPCQPGLTRPSSAPLPGGTAPRGP
jgi:hypothetical protein